MKVEAVELIGEHIFLRQMRVEDLDGLSRVGLEPSIWEFTPGRVSSRDDIRTYIDEALSDQKRGTALPFVTVLQESNKIVGSTRFGNIDRKNLRVEIGWTWVTVDWQRSFVNTEAKLLMLTHAFEVWKCNRVEFKTDAINLKSRNAILRLGARRREFFGSI